MESRTDRSRIRLERVVPEPISDVWTAWTTEHGLASWWWTHWDDTTCQVDLRIGGSYRISAPGAGITVHGTYEHLDPPNRIDATWIWTDTDGEGPTEHLRIDLEPADDGATRISVTHTGPWTTPEPGENYRQGWEHVLTELATRSS